MNEPNAAVSGCEAVRSAELLDSIRGSFKIAISALVQAQTSLEMLGFEPTKREVKGVVDDLRKAVAKLDEYKSNDQVEFQEGSGAE